MTEFRYIPGFPLYQVTDDGEVWSCRRGKFLALCPTTTDDYLQVNLYVGKKWFTRKVHKIVLESFVGLKPDGYESRHLNGNSRDNRLSNLCWGTPKENGQDKVKHGTSRKGIPLSDAHRAALRENRTGRNRSAEMVEKWKDPIFREKMLASRMK